VKYVLPLSGKSLELYNTTDVTVKEVHTMAHGFPITCTVTNTRVLFTAAADKPHILSPLALRLASNDGAIVYAGLTAH